MTSHWPCLPRLQRLPRAGRQRAVAPRAAYPEQHVWISDRGRSHCTVCLKFVYDDVRKAKLDAMGCAGPSARMVSILSQAEARGHVLWTASAAGKPYF
eukprot:10080957-Lingulodinium_polyedra.AAC.1